MRIAGRGKLTRDVLGVAGLMVEALQVQEVVLVHEELEHHRAAAGQLLAARHDAGVARDPRGLHLILVCTTQECSLMAYNLFSIAWCQRASPGLHAWLQSAKLACTCLTLCRI